VYALPKIYLQKIPKGYWGTLKTIEHIIDLIKQGAKDFYVGQTAIDILLQRGDWSKMPSSSLHFGMHHMAREALFT
jgi:hypothetical protein